MVTIIQGFRQPNPIADSIRNAANTLFGPARMDAALKRSRLNLQEQEFARQNAEAIALDALAGSFDPGGDPTTRRGNAVRSGFSAGDLGRLGLQEAAEGFSGDLTDETGLNVGRAQLGAGLATSSAVPGFLASEEQDAALRREAIRASTGASIRAAEIAAAQRAQAAREALAAAQAAKESELVSGIDVVTGNPAFRERGSVDFRFAPLTTLSQRQAAELDRLLRTGSLDELERSVLTGAAPSQDQVQADAIRQAVEASGLDLGQIPQQNILESLDLGGGDAPTVRRFQTPDGQSFRSVDNGLTDLDTGQSIPANAVEIGKVSATSLTDAGLSPTSTNASAVFNEAAALRDFQDLVGITRTVAESDPTIFGLVGAGRSAAQGLTNVANSLDALFGGEGGFQAEIEKAQRAVLDPNITEPGARNRFAGLFDPNLDAIQRLSTLLVFQGASALAGQEGRGLSDKDVKLFEGVFGNPQGVFASQASFLNALNVAEQILQRRLQANVERQRGEFNTAVPTGAPLQSRTRIKIDTEGNIVQ